jgi:hypothetical protein
MQLHTPVHASVMIPFAMANIAALLATGLPANFLIDNRAKDCVAWAQSRTLAHVVCLS